MVRARQVGIRVALFSALTLAALARAPVGKPAPVSRAGEPVRAAAARRPAHHSKDEGDFVHAISRARAPRPLGIDRA
jgi:hypothetical protein